MRARTTLTLILVFSVLVFGAPLVAAAEDGKAVFKAQKCNTCHDVSSAGIAAKTTSEKLKGPDLTGVGKRHDAGWIAKYLKKATTKDGKSHAVPFKGTDEELQALVDWLLEQKAGG